VAATPVSELAQAIIDIGEPDLMLIEGAGGVLVRLDDAGATVADLASQIGADVLVVTTAGLGTLNAAALTGEALRRRGLTCTGAVIGDWPREPGLAELCNLDDLPDYLNAPLLGALPAGVGGFCPAEFLRVAQASLAPPLGGTWSV